MKEDKFRINTEQLNLEILRLQKKIEDFEVNSYNLQKEYDSMDLSEQYKEIMSKERKNLKNIEYIMKEYITVLKNIIKIVEEYKEDNV